MIPFTEKFRPNEFGDIYNNNNIDIILSQCLKKKDIPHFLFYGNSGNGKTTSIMTYIKKLYGSYTHQNVIYLNASDDRGINTVREKIKTFSKLSTSGNDLKIIVLDEADNMTNDAQSALRRIMEIYSKNTRFIIICNYVNKIIEPIISRCCQVKFNPLTDEQINKIITKVETELKFEIHKKIKDYLVEETRGDARKTLNLLECLYQIYYSKKNTFENNDVLNTLNDLTGNIDNIHFKEFLKEIEDGNIENFPSLISSFMNQNYDTNKIIKKFIKYFHNLKMNENIKNDVITNLYDLLKKIFEGTPEEIAFRYIVYQYKYIYNNYLN
jgi:DNA polymerase III delta prime subunit